MTETTTEVLDAFRNYLLREEKSPHTIEKYLRDARTFLLFAGTKELSKSLTVQYKQHLVDCNYAIRSINSMLASLNCLMEYLEREDCKVKTLKSQRQTYCAEDQELTKDEYVKLLRASVNHPTLKYVMQTLCATGIRVSELKYFTAEAVKEGEVCVRCKNKTRRILIPRELRNLLLDYAKERNIRTGPIFTTRNGKPLDRSNIWSQMKSLCKTAGVKPTKVFPHNLRKLFARTFYSVDRDIAKLADLLGHGSIETTRIYIMSTGTEHRRKIEKLGLVVRE